MPAPASPEPLYREAGAAALVGLAANVALAAIKLTAGILGSSFALVADGVNSIGDAFNSAVVLYALRVAQKPPDEEHPYGHTRAEAIAASNLAVLLMVTACGLAWEAVTRLGERLDTPPGWILWIAAGNVVLKESLCWYKLRVGRRTGSAAVIAGAWDHRSDALCSLAVLVGLTAIRLGGPQFLWADVAAALVVAAAVFFSAVRLFRSSASELMDVQANPELVADVRRTAEEMPGVLGVEQLRLRKSGLEYFADMHIEVDPRITVEEGHRLGHRVKDELLHRVAALRHVLVHLEPHPHSHDENES